MKRQSFEVYFKTISWHGDYFINGASSAKIHLDTGKIEEGGIHYAFDFDRATTSPNGRYTLIYQNLGTKGLLLKDGKFLREVNRSFYHADVYEYPAIFWQRSEEETYLIHCPNEYCRLDIEEVETGNIISDHSDRKPSDFFHSRLEISPNGKMLISRGWCWHPWDAVEVFDLDACFSNPLLLDNAQMASEGEGEIFAASFIDEQHLLLGESDDADNLGKGKPDIIAQVKVWNISTNTVSDPVPLDFAFGGHVMAIDDTYAWDMYQYPKIFNFRTGRIVDKCEDIFSGHQQSSIIHHIKDLPIIVFNKQTRQMAVLNNHQLDVLTPEEKYEL